MSRISPIATNGAQHVQQTNSSRNNVSPLPPIQPPCIRRNSSSSNNSPRPPPAMNKAQLRILTRHSSSSPHSGVSASNRMPSPVSSLVDDHTDTDDDEELEDVPIGNIDATNNKSNNSGKTPPPELIPTSSKESTTSSSNFAEHNASGRSTPILSQAALAQLDQRNTISNQYANIHHYPPLQNPNYLQQQSNNNNMHPPSNNRPLSPPLSPANTTAIQTTSQNNNAKSITPLHQIPYVHGGYAAAAPLFITDSKFASILKKLLPSAYYELSILLKNSNSIPKSVVVARMEGSRDRDAAKVGTISEHQGSNNNKQGGVPKARLKRISSVERLKRLSSCTVDTSTNTTATINGDGKSEVILSDPVKIMKWAENNPVVSAFGIWNSDSGRRTIKFMQGIQLLQQPIPLLNNNNTANSNFEEGNREEDLDDRQSFISGGGYTESVVTIGSNGNNFGYRNSMMGYQPQRHTATAHNTTTANPLHGMASKRRKQPEPDPIPEMGIEVTTLGVGVSTTTIPPKPRYNKPALEWDVFLDPSLVKQVDNAMSIVDKLEVKLRKIRIKRERKKAVATTMKYNRTSSRGSGAGIMNSENTRGTHVDTDIEEEDENDDDFDILQSHTAAQVEVDRLVSQLMRRTIIAHGSMSQLVLEAMGVAPKYNFGRVVKSSRDNPPSHSPSRSSKRVSLRVGNTEAEISINMNTTSEWDDDEEQRDFEALLDPSILNNSTTASDTKNGNQQQQQQSNTARRPTSGSSGGSKGMFMETWIHVFSQTLSLLVKSSKSDATTSGDDGIATKSSSASSKSNISIHNGSRQHQQHLLVKNRPAKIGERGLSGLLERMFLRRDSSVNEVTAGGEQSDDIIEDQDGNDQALDCYGGEDDDASDLLTNNDMFSPATPTSSSFGMGMCGMSLCLGMNDSDSKISGGRGASSSTFPINPHASHKMTHDIERISTVLGEPLRLVLDLKSRRVPPRVWSRLIDSLRTRGLIIEGIGSFDMDELRVIGKGCSYPLTPLLFFHSVGDLQRACHANEVKNGDTVYFNGGSLMWKRSSIMEAAERGCCGTVDTGQDNDITATGDGIARSPRNGGNYSFQPYAFPRSALSDWERAKVKATIEDYRRHFNLKIGVYVQEFSISAEALDALSVFVNKHGDLYDQGLAFGGINGAAVKNISGDGYWNQRYMGRPWDFDARPSSEMTPLAPEDHHLVQKAIQAGAWGQVMDAYEVRDEQAGALTVLQPEPLILREPCNIINDYG